MGEIGVYQEKLRKIRRNLGVSGEIEGNWGKSGKIGKMKEN